MRWIMKIMGQGLVVFIPLALTIGLVLVLGVWVENLLGNSLKGILPEGSDFYRMGMGTLSFLVLVFVIGLLMNMWVFRKLFKYVEGWIMRLPLVKTVYGAVNDVMKFIGGGKGEKKFDMVVMVEQENGWRQLGIVTRQDFEGLPKELTAGQEDSVVVYIPFGYQLGGFSYFIERRRCTPVPGMSAEDAMRYSVMAWLGAGDEKK